MSNVTRKWLKNQAKIIAGENPHMRAAKNRNMNHYSDAKKQAYQFIMGNLFYLKNDAERARWVLSYSESLFNYGQDSLRKKMQAGNTLPQDGKAPLVAIVEK